MNKKNDSSDKDLIYLKVFRVHLIVNYPNYVNYVKTFLKICEAINLILLDLLDN
jgi:hypothetical protein